MANDTRCRSCMRESENFTPLFGNTDDTDEPLADCIEYVTGLRVQQEDGLPDQVCEECFLLARSASLFKERYLRSHDDYKAASRLSLQDVDLTKTGRKYKEEQDTIGPNDKPFQCAVCNKRYPVSSHLQAHVKQVHKELMETAAAAASLKSSSKPKTRLACSLCSKVILKKSYNRHFKRCSNNKAQGFIPKEDPDSSDSDTPLADICRQNGTEDDCSLGEDPIRMEPETLLFVIDEMKVEAPNEEAGPDEDVDRAADSPAEAKVVPGESEVKIKIRKDIYGNDNGMFMNEEFVNGSEEEDGGDADAAESRYPCSMCPMKFSDASSLALHARKHVESPMEVHTCLTCKREFKKLKHLENHMLTHFMPQPSVQPEAAETPKPATPPGNKLNGRKKHACKFCDKSFDMLCTLKDHLRIHTGEKPFICPHCNRGFSQRTNLKEHVRRHQGSKPFQCDHCDQAFVSKGELKAHTRKHSGAHPFVCDLCGGGFTTSSSLSKHKRIHTGERRYKCNFCPMRFTAIDTLTKHRRTHTGEKPYKCTYCEKAFAQRNDLKTHTRTHTGERPYSCATCNMAFRQKSALKTHYKVHNRPPKDPNAVKPPRKKKGDAGAEEAPAAEVIPEEAAPEDEDSSLMISYGYTLL